MNLYTKNKNRTRLCMLWMAVLMTATVSGNAFAQDETSGAAQVMETEQSADQFFDKTETESQVSPSEPAIKNEEIGSSDTGHLSVSGYEIDDTDRTENALDTVRKGRQVNIIVYVKGDGIRTDEVGKSGISVGRLKDSFQRGSTPKVKVTSEKDEDLEYTVTFSKLTYNGKGNSLKFRTNFKKGAFSQEVLEVGIEECEEGSRRDREDSGTTGQPIIKIKRIAPQTPVGQGEKFTLELSFENTSSDADIEDLVVTVNPGNVFFINDDTNSAIISRLNTRKSSSIKLNMAAGTELSGPTQSIELELKYSYDSGGGLVTGTSSQKVLIPVKGGSVSGQPVIRVSRSDTGRSIGANETFELMVKLENTSADRDVRNLSATFDSNEQISLREDTDTRQLGELKAGQSIEVPLHLRSGAELSSSASQLFGISLKFDYDSDKGPVQGTYGEKLVIPTQGQEKSPGDPTPNIIVSNYTYGEKVIAGQVFELEMEFMNTSKTLPVENVVMSLDTGEGISINSSSNTFYMSKLGPGGKQRVKVQVQALFQSKLQSPKLSISGKYEYVDKKERKQISANETIAIPVYQPDRFQVKQPEFTETIRQGEETTISIPYVNKGRGQIFNVEAKLEGEIAAIEKELTLGNYEAGKSGTIDFLVTPEKTGQFTGRVVVTYEDEAMEVKTLDIPITFMAEEGVSEAGENSAELIQEETSLRTGKWTWIMGAAAFMLITILLLKMRDRAKKKKAREEEDDRQEAWEEEEPSQEEQT